LGIFNRTGPPERGNEQTNEKGPPDERKNVRALICPRLGLVPLFLRFVGPAPSPPRIRYRPFFQARWFLGNVKTPPAPLLPRPGNAQKPSPRKF